jgi:SpoVK/Ycf46/Vps4 family AAA+-type ATPase
MDTEKLEKYEHIRLPRDPWRRAGEALVLAPEVTQTAARFGQWRLREGGEGSGLLLFSGPPGTGKSVLARFTADAAVRASGERGNALIVNTPALFSEELGRSAKLVAELFAAVELSAARVKTVLLWDDAEGIFCSREQVLEAKEPTDLLRVIQTLNAGFDRLCEMKNVLQIATGNFTQVLDPAIVDRIDLVITFALPTLAERREILRRRVHGLAGEQVLEELAQATEGWSGRRLAKIVMQAYLASTAPMRAELSAADFLAAVGLAPEPITSVEEAPAGEAETVTAAIEKEEVVCPIESSNGSPQAVSPRRSRLIRPWMWFQKPLSA